MATMGVGRIPGRKRPALWIKEGNEIRILAFFSSGKTMHEFLKHKPLYTSEPSEEWGEVHDVMHTVVGPLTRTEHARRARELHNGS